MDIDRRRIAVVRVLAAAHEAKRWPLGNGPGGEE